MCARHELHTHIGYLLRMWPNEMELFLGSFLIMPDLERTHTQRDRQPMNFHLSCLHVNATCVSFFFFSLSIHFLDRKFLEIGNRMCFLQRFF